MKKILLFITVLTLIITGCQKKEIEVVESNITTGLRVYTLLAYNDSTVFDYCDSSLINVYNESDELVQTGYTKNGYIDIVPVTKGYHYFTFESRTYTNNYQIYHFRCKWELKTDFIGNSSMPSKYHKNTYVCVGGGIGKYDGYGCTEVPIYDKFNRVKPFNVNEGN